MVVLLVKSPVLNVCIFLAIEFTIPPNFELCLVCKYLEFMFVYHI